MPRESGWTIAVPSCLKAHFKQPVGPSRPGADWLAVLTNGSIEKRILVRQYFDPELSIDLRKQAQIVAEYVAQLMKDGWSPDSYTAKPGELTVPTADGSSAVPAHSSKPWWRFW